MEPDSQWDDFVRSELETAPVVEVFSKPTAVKIMTLLVQSPDQQSSQSEIARQAGISRKTVNRNMGLLAHYGLIEIHGSDLTVDLDSEPVQGFLHLHDAMLSETRSDPEGAFESFREMREEDRAAAAEGQPSKSR